MDPVNPPGPPLPYDAEVQYLKGTGTQYIKTGIAPDSGIQITCRFAAKIVKGKVQGFPFWIDRSQYGIGMYQTQANQPRWVVGYLNPMSNPIAKYPDEEWHDLDIFTDSPKNSGYLKLDGEILNIGQYGGTIGETQVILFARASSYGSFLDAG